MKKFSLLFILSLLFIACKDDASIEELLPGQWQLTAVLADPGDGSGTFKPVESDQRIKFNSDGTFSVPGTFCTTTFADLIESTGTWDIEKSILVVDDCPLGDQAGYPFRIEHGQLIVNRLCIEPCMLRYTKVAAF